MENRKLLHNLFIFSLVVTGLFGVLEIVSGLGLVFSDVDKLASFLKHLTITVVAEQPPSVFTNYFSSVINNFNISASTKTITIIWLFVHGTTNTLISYFVLQGKLWIYPYAITAFLVLAVYQIYELVLYPTLPLAILAIIACTIVILAMREYQIRQRYISRL